MVSAIPNPGSNEAQNEGCRCPSQPDRMGGWGGNSEKAEALGFFVATGCPLHDAQEAGECDG